MSQRSRFSNQVLIGLLSLGFVGAVAAHPSNAAPAAEADSAGQATEVPNSGTSTGSPSQTSNTYSTPTSQASARYNAPVNTINSPSAENDRNSAVRSPATFRQAAYTQQTEGPQAFTPERTTAGQTVSQRDVDSQRDADSVNTVNQPAEQTDRDGNFRSPNTLAPQSGTQNSMQSGERSMQQSSSSTQNPSPSDDAVNTINQPAEQTDRDGNFRSPATLEPQTTSPSSDASSDSVTQVVSDNDNFSTLATAIEAAGLGQVLGTQGPLTLFAPTNEAFAALPPETLQRLLEPQNRQVLRQILAYHLIPGSYPSSGIQSGQVETAAGAPVAISTSGSEVTVGEATVVEPDITASNGVIHGIDRVLLPPNLQLQ
ncbi:fasciclin domain-containing protein [Phormidium tenue FACHB-886]|nr:fasciclin domain-containing protein [Phormidium tenue FACHB-886]